MKLEGSLYATRNRWRLPKQTLLIMKFTAIILLSACLTASANGFSQNVTLSEKNASLEKVFQEIKKQTGYVFFYNYSLMEKAKPITLKVKDVTVEEALTLCFKDQPLGFVIENRTVIVTERKQLAEDKPKANLPPPPIDIRGRVVNEAGEPVVVTVLVKGTQNGTTTNSDGYFELKGVDENATLVISGVSIAPVEVKVSGRTNINVTVKITATEGEDVVVKTNYWEVKQRENPGNISRVTAIEIEKQPVSNPVNALQGRMPGVYIQQRSGLPGANVELNIRGLNSLANGNSPLYVIDGVPFGSQSLSVASLSNLVSGSSGISPLNSLNPLDIESIEILKDADATAIYGSRGANGVVLITTKKGKSGKTSFEINSYSGFGKVTRTMDLLNTQEYLQMRREAYANDGVSPTTSNAPDLLLWDTTRYTDWQNVLFGGTAKTNNIQSSLSGGNSNTRFLFNAGYFKETTVYPGDLNYQKGSSHLSVQHTSNDKKLFTNISVNFIFDKNNLLFNDFVGTARTLAPNAPKLYNDNGELNWENSTWTNPLAELERTYQANNKNLITNAVFSYEVIPGLQIKANLGYNQHQLKEIMLNPHTALNPALGRTSSVSYSRHNKTTNQSWIIEPQIAWSKSVGKSEFSVLAGSSFQEQNSDQFAVQARGYSSNALIQNISAAATLFILADNASKYRYNGYYGRMNYKYLDRYIINLTGRRDGSSRFGPEKQFSNFGAVGAAWLFSKEDFIEKALGFLSYGKLRISYGTSGNDQIGDYQFLNTYSAGSATYQGLTGLSPSSLFNPELAWEINRKFEAGLELSFLSDKLNISGSYFRNRSSNQLVDYKLPLTTGFNTIKYNFPATIQNTGVEIEFGAQIISHKDFKWNCGFNITIPRNKLVEFPELESSTYANTYVIGYPLTIYKRYKYLGIDQQSGIYQFQDVNGDGVISYNDDRAAIIEYGQKFYGGLSNTLIYKNFQLDFFFQFVKQTGFNFWTWGAWPGFMSNQPAFILNRWQNPNDNKVVQAYSAGFNNSVNIANSNMSFSDNAIGDASFIRLRNVYLSYNLNEKITKGKRCRLFLQGQNILTITNYLGADPESMNFTALPPLRTWTAGVQIIL